jgi:hypothetical protein
MESLVRTNGPTEIRRRRPLGRLRVAAYRSTHVSKNTLEDQVFPAQQFSVKLSEKFWVTEGFEPVLAAGNPRVALREIAGKPANCGCRQASLCAEVPPRNAELFHHRTIAPEPATMAKLPGGRSNSTSAQRLVPNRRFLPSAVTRLDPRRPWRSVRSPDGVVQHA